MPGLRLSLLGPPRVEQENRSLEINRRKAMALLAYLAVEADSHRREALAAMLWPDYTQARALANLRRDLSVLNKVLGEGWLEIDREVVGLARRRGFWLDVDQFRQGLANSEAHRHPAGALCPDCLAALRQAAALYRGDFLAGFTLPDSPSFDEWQRFQTESLRWDLAGALEKLAQGLAGRGQFEAAIPHARRRLELDPWHEPAQRQLMRLYAWAGQPAAALRQYQDCVRVLDEELGLPPEEATRELYEAIKSKEAPPAPSRTEAQSTTVPLPTAHPPNLRVPSQLTPFVGREKELAEITHLLRREPACRLLSLVGPGGIGKTRLALQAAGETGDAFAQGVRVAPLASVPSTAFLVSSLAEVLDLSFQGGTDPKEQLLNYLREKELLLVLDNFEHLLDGAGLVTDILSHAPRVTLLITSRERLNLQAEWVLEIRGLTFPGREETAMADAEARPGAGTADSTGIAALEEYSAVKFFMQSARRYVAGFSLPAAEQPDVVGICQAVEGMPLALELSAAWTGMMPCREILQEIEQNLDFLTTTWQDIPARHQSLRAVFEHSWQRLSETERRVFRDLSVFRGGFRRQAAAQVANAPLPVLAALVNKSLLRGHPSGRYDMHELLGKYAAERLGEVPAEREQVLHRHSAFYAAFLRERAQDLTGRRQQEALAEIAAEIGNVRAAWRWAVDHGQVAEIEQALESLYLFYLTRSWFHEGEQAFERAAASLRERADPGSRSESALGQLLIRLGRFSYRLANYPKAGEHLEEGLVIFQHLAEEGQLAAQQEVALALSGLADVARGRGAYLEAEQLCGESLSIYRQCGDQLGMAEALNRLGIVAGSLGRYEEAQQLFEETLALYEAVGNQFGLANTLTNLGIVADALGQFAEAKELYQQGLSIRRQLGHRWGVGVSLSNLGYQAFRLGEYAEAKQLFQESYKLHKEIGDPRMISHALNNLGDVTCALGENQQSWRYLAEALGIGLEIRAFPLVLEVLVSLAGLLAAGASEEQARAVELLALALHHPAIERRPRDRAENLLAELAAGLPPEVVAAAQKRGQAGSLETVVAELLRQRPA